MTGLVDKLHRIRVRRESRALGVLRARADALAAAERVRSEARGLLEAHVQSARREVALAWDGVIGRQVMRAQVDRVRALEAARRRGEAELAASLEAAAERVADARAARTDAAQRLSAARRAVAKLDEVRADLRRDAGVRDRRSADNDMDEFAMQRAGRTA